MFGEILFVRERQLLHHSSPRASFLSWKWRRSSVISLSPIPSSLLWLMGIFTRMVRLRIFTYSEGALPGHCYSAVCQKTARKGVCVGGGSAKWQILHWHNILSVQGQAENTSTQPWGKSPMKWEDKLLLPLGHLQENITCWMKVTFVLPSSLSLSSGFLKGSFVQPGLWDWHWLDFCNKWGPYCFIAGFL